MTYPEQSLCDAILLFVVTCEDKILLFACFKTVFTRTSHDFSRFSICLLSYTQLSLLSSGIAVI
jgi:hypothetical protein